MFLLPTFFTTITQKLSQDAHSSDEVRQAASRFSSDVKLDFLSYLFRQDYGNGRKLIFLWDEFDTAYNSPEMQQLCAGALREVKNTASSLPAYGAVMCFGTYCEGIHNGTVGYCPSINPEICQEAAWTGANDVLGVQQGKCACPAAETD